ncbi:hypothetical protein H6P81_010583 [Aristolochia fimbriata]|uniref:mitogen-activated protein kinase kinase n=1 Tax=Aristolochia fimbriata TaxID=158543 RepID=A0AAV7ETL7_ARIFI|nr:hypothetical protein H6P81_010583 [Aristolochia fimbriata]
MAMRRKRNLTLNLPYHRPASTDLPLRPSLFPVAPSTREIITTTAYLKTLSTLGHGNGGTVYKVRHAQTSAVYALKIIQVPISTSSGDCEADHLLRSCIATEMDILTRVDSPYVVRCHGMFKKDSAGDDMAFVLEYMDVGSLASLLYPSKGEPTAFSEDMIASVAKQVLRGLAYLHGLGIVHRDIKPANLLVNSKMEVKIADFGVSEIVSRDAQGHMRRCSSYIGTHAYMSPERFDPGSHGGSYDGFAADVWSLGITLWELYLGSFPLVPSGKKPDWATLLGAICLDDMPGFLESASAEFQDFLSCCLHKDSSERATVADLLRHPFLTAERPAAPDQY